MPHPAWSVVGGKKRFLAGVLDCRNVFFCVCGVPLRCHQKQGGARLVEKHSFSGGAGLVLVAAVK